jgi:hypothetical protein
MSSAPQAAADMQIVNLASCASSSSLLQTAQLRVISTIFHGMLYLVRRPNRPVF